jgi:hypothetical protein
MTGGKKEERQAKEWEGRKTRLGAALRANLLKRKAQARERQKNSPEDRHNRE